MDAMKISFIVATLASCIVTVNCISCYVCDSTSSANCGDPFSNEGLTTTNCTSSATKCFKSESSLLGVDFVSRGCGDLGTDCVDVLGISTCHSSCDDVNNCNASSMITASSIIFMVVCAIGKLM
ncbi:uncharacterized protein [Antedon mediterranea]|uniref:uncharacterized protein n=1 Tax=Antedon mediterranea TaxID=105859 RepID=UPI003AF5E4F0